MIFVNLPMPGNCHVCDAVGITDLYSFTCPAQENKNKHYYIFDKRPESCPLKELTENERKYLYDILCKQDWTETAICDAIIKKLELRSRI